MQLVERPVLDHAGFTQAIRTWHNLSPAELYEARRPNDEAAVGASGP